MATLGHAAAVRSVIFSPEGNRIMTSSSDDTVRMWDTQSGQLLFTLTGQTNRGNPAVFSPDGKRIVTVGSGLSSSPRV
jgi:WD40 repeat protein